MLDPMRTLEQLAVQFRAAIIAVTRGKTIIPTVRHTCHIPTA